jgi:hypothetical protein
MATTRRSNPPRSLRLRAGLVAAAVAAVAGTLGAAPVGAQPRALIHPAITLQAAPWVIAPAHPSAKALIAAPASIKGVLTLDLYPLEDSTCSSAPSQTWDVAIDGLSGSVASAPPFIGDDEVGGHYWQASFVGDSFVDSVATGCTRQEVLPVGSPPSYPFETWDVWATRIHQDLLGRAPSAGELSAATAGLTAGTMTPGDVAQAIREGADHRANVDPSVRLYEAYFLRIPEVAGLKYWIGARRGGRSLPSVSDFFASSSEFKNRYGTLTDAQFVDLVYQNVLGRLPDSAGASFWTGQLSGKRRTRGGVMLGFSESPEYIRIKAPEVQVVVLHALLFGRRPAGGTLVAHTTLLKAGTLTMAGYADQLLHRDVYLARP